MPATIAINEVTLARYLQAHIDQFKGPLKLTKFKGGQSNPTFKLDTNTGTYVLRCQPAGKLLKSAHAVDREYRVLKALKESDVPVPTVYHLCEDHDVMGVMFYVMEFCKGEIYWNAALPEVASNERRTAIYDEMSRVLAAIHDVDVNAVGLADYGKPGNYFERQLSRWTAQYRASETRFIPKIDELITWLAFHLPEDDGKVGLSHGDYRLDNLIFAKDYSIKAVLDWELSTLGHPYADLAYQCMQLRLPAKDDKTSSSGLLGVDREALGIPTEEEYVSRYCSRRGISQISGWVFYMCFSFFRLAAICQGVAKRAVDGNASGDDASRVGAMVEQLAQMAIDTIDRQR